MFSVAASPQSCTKFAPDLVESMFHICSTLVCVRTCEGLVFNVLYMRIISPKPNNNLGVSISGLCIRFAACSGGVVAITVGKTKEGQGVACTQALMLVQTGHMTRYNVVEKGFGPTTLAHSVPWFWAFAGNRGVDYGNKLVSKASTSEIQE